MGTETSVYCFCCFGVNLVVWRGCLGCRGDVCRLGRELGGLRDFTPAFGFRSFFCWFWICLQCDWVDCYCYVFVRKGKARRNGWQETLGSVVADRTAWGRSHCFS
jgi:hypothetical protein